MPPRLSREALDVVSGDVRRGRRRPYLALRRFPLLRRSARGSARGSARRSAVRGSAIRTRVAVGADEGRANARVLASDEEPGPAESRRATSTDIVDYKV